MRGLTFAVALVCCCTLPSADCDGQQRITLVNEIDRDTGHDNHMVGVQLFGDHAEITYCKGTETSHLLPLIEILQSDSCQPVTLRLVHSHEFDIANRGWVIIGICNRVKDSGPSILVYSSPEIDKAIATSLGQSFKAMRDLPVSIRPRDELVTFFTPSS